MREKKPTLVITFHTTTQAMAMERSCMDNGLPGRLIPVPREITASCGLAWKASPTEETLLLGQMRSAGLQWDQVYTIRI